MGRRSTFFTTGLVFLFFAEGQRAFFGSLLPAVSDALKPTADAGPLLLALLPLAALLLPFVPLARWVDRQGAVAVAVGGLAVFRLPMSHPGLETRLVGGAFVLAFFALFLRWAVGFLDRRAMAGGAVAGLVADQLLRLAGASYDLSLQPAWLPVQVLLSLSLLVAAVLWGRDREAGQQGEGGGAGGGGRGTGLERRAGGLRLRGALALGPVLFLDLHVLGLAPVLSRWTGVPYEAAALLSAGAAGLALALVLAGAEPTRGRRTLLTLVALVAGAVAAGWWWGGAVAAVLMAAGHGAALLLAARSLDPASGRRSGSVVSAALGALVLLTAAYSLTFHPAFGIPAAGGAAPWVFGAALLVLAAASALLPQAPGTVPALAPMGGVAAAAGVIIAAAGLSWVAAQSAPAHPSPAAAPARLRVATLNVSHGFDESRRFDPHAVERALSRAGADVAALHQVSVGLPAAYGVDLPLWLARRTGTRRVVAPDGDRLLGHALLLRPPAIPVPHRSLPGSSVAGRMLRAVGFLGDHPVQLYALSTRARAAEPDGGLASAFQVVEPGSAVVVGDTAAFRQKAVLTRLREAGFRAVVSTAGARDAAFHPSDPPTTTRSQIWVRGLMVQEAGDPTAGSWPYPAIVTLVAPPS